MRVRPLTVASVCLLACTGTREPTAPIAPAAAVESRDYAVYDAVLEALFIAGAPAGTSPRHVIIDSTSLGGRIIEDGYFRQQFGAFFPIVEAIRGDYALRSSVQVPLDARRFRARGRVDLVSRQTLASLDKSTQRNPDTHWRAYYDRFPGSHGYISFSRPGYDAAGTHALLSYGHGCGGRCGDWGLVLLERRDETWVVLRRVLTVVS